MANATERTKLESATVALRECLQGHAGDTMDLRLITNWIAAADAAKPGTWDAIQARMYVSLMVERLMKCQGF